MKKQTLLMVGIVLVGTSGAAAFLRLVKTVRADEEKAAHRQLWRCV
jgi:hypothetical protein